MHGFGAIGRGFYKATIKRGLKKDEPFAISDWQYGYVPRKNRIEAMIVIARKNGWCKAGNWSCHQTLAADRSDLLERLYNFNPPWLVSKLATSTVSVISSSPS